MHRRVLRRLLPQTHYSPRNLLTSCVTVRVAKWVYAGSATQALTWSTRSRLRPLAGRCLLLSYRIEKKKRGDKDDQHMDIFKTFSAVRGDYTVQTPDWGESIDYARIIGRRIDGKGMLRRAQISFCVQHSLVVNERVCTDTWIHLFCLRFALSKMRLVGSSCPFVARARYSLHRSVFIENYSSCLRTG